MGFVMSIMSIFLLYVLRFKKDFDEEQVNTFLSACIVIFLLFILCTWLMNR